MSVHRILAIAAIFFLATAGWQALGLVTKIRSEDSSSRLGASVEQMWGQALVQQAPVFAADVPGTEQKRPVMPSMNQVAVELTTDYRKKGLMWYPTYVCNFDGTYTVTNEEAVAQKIRMHFSFPSETNTYDNFAAYVSDRQLTGMVDTHEGVQELVELGPGETLQFRVAYSTRGLGQWHYDLGQVVGRVRGLNLTVNTNFQAVDFPEGSLSPMSMKENENGGKTLHWEAQDLITRQPIGVLLPEKLNPGPLTARITFFAPVCLLFFFVLVATISIVYRVDIHPMHFLFIAAGFFAFHLLLAYLVGLVNIHISFVVAALVAITLVTSYLTAALRGQFPWKVAVAGQLFFLVLFSYSFFFKGITGLTVAIGSVLTLAVLMKATAHLDWTEVFSRPLKQTRVPVPPPLLRPADAE